MSINGNSIISKSKAYIAARNALGDHRKLFDTLESALGALRTIYSTEGFPAAFPVIAAGIDQTIDVSGPDTIPPLDKWPSIYTAPGVTIAVTFIGQRGLKDENGKEANGARGFAIAPIHAIDNIRATEAGETWLWKVAEKEQMHVALRGVRNADPALGNDALVAAAASMPLAVDDYVEEATRDSLDTSSFDAVWKQFRKMLAEHPGTAMLVAALPSKPEVLKAIRSKAYAEQEYADLEKMGTFEFIADRIAIVIDSMHRAATEAGTEFELDSSEIRGWLAGRATKVFQSPRKVEVDLSKVNFAAFVAAAPSMADQPANESAT